MKKKLTKSETLIWCAQFQREAVASVAKHFLTAQQVALATTEITDYFRSEFRDEATRFWRGDNRVLTDSAKEDSGYYEKFDFSIPEIASVQDSWPDHLTSRLQTVQLQPREDDGPTLIPDDSVKDFAWFNAVTSHTVWYAISHGEFHLMRHQDEVEKLSNRNNFYLKHKYVDGRTIPAWENMPFALKVIFTYTSLLSLHLGTEMGQIYGTQRIVDYLQQLGPRTQALAAIVDSLIHELGELEKSDENKVVLTRLNQVVDDALNAMNAMYAFKEEASPTSTDNPRLAHAYRLQRSVKRALKNQQPAELRVETEVTASTYGDLIKAYHRLLTECDRAVKDIGVELEATQKTLRSERAHLNTLKSLKELAENKSLQEFWRFFHNTVTNNDEIIARIVQDEKQQQQWKAERYWRSSNDSNTHFIARWAFNVVSTTRNVVKGMSKQTVLEALVQAEQRQSAKVGELQGKERELTETLGKHKEFQRQLKTNHPHSASREQWVARLNILIKKVERWSFRWIFSSRVREIAKITEDLLRRHKRIQEDESHARPLQEGEENHAEELQKSKSNLMRQLDATRKAVDDDTNWFTKGIRSSFFSHELTLVKTMHDEMVDLVNAAASAAAAAPSA